MYYVLNVCCCVSVIFSTVSGRLSAVAKRMGDARPKHGGRQEEVPLAIHVSWAPGHATIYDRVVTLSVDNHV